MEYKKIIDSFNNRICLKDHMSTSTTNTNNNNNNSNNDNNIINTFTITLIGNGSEPPFNNQGLILESLGNLRIIIPSGLQISCKSPILYTNYPSKESDLFDRNKFISINSINNKNDGSNEIVFELNIKRYGCFDYYVEWEDQADNNNKIKGTMGTFQINPLLKVNNVNLPGDAIILQTFLTKCLGPLTDWENHIDAASKLGYNMIHYTPVQEIGASGSSYSIFDQQSIGSKIFPNGGDEQTKLNKLKEFVDLSESKYNILSMIDLVWNHTAHNSKWLNEHPEAGYNTENSTHLKPAVVLDSALMNYGIELYGKEIKSIEHLDQIIADINEKAIKPIKLWEYYVLDVDREVELFKTKFYESSRVKDNHIASSTFSPTFLKGICNPASERQEIINSILKKGTIRDAGHERFSLHIDESVVYKILDNSSSFDHLTKEEQISKYRDILDVVNLNLYKLYDSDTEAILKNIGERIKYERIALHGPKLGPISKSKPLLNTYFTWIQFKNTNGSIREIPLANNGWVFNHNPTVDFASKDSRAYLRRDVIIWGDCVKMRYGNSPSDNPWLWEHMKTYTQKMAKVFHAIRIDNCHSTPIQVAQYLLDAARQVRPNIYVTCELFTGSEEIDNVFVKRLGINSLIREAMVCYDSGELSRVTHRYGGHSIGSIEEVGFKSKFSSGTTSQPYNTKSIKPSLPPALFMDCTHDNETPYQKRTVFDTVPNAAVVAMTASAIGSTRGYDEIFPKTIDLVNETRVYKKNLNLNSGVFPIRTLLNKLHLELALNEYSQVHVHRDNNIIFIQRYSPKLKQSIFMVTHTAFNPVPYETQSVHISVPCKISEFMFGARITYVHGENYKVDQDTLTGFPVDTEILYGEKVLNTMCRVENEYTNEHPLRLNLSNFPSGSILLFRGEIPKDSINSMNAIDSLINNQDSIINSLDKINFVDLNYLLFRTGDEEREATGNSSYSLDNIGSLPFCGLTGFSHLLKRIAEFNDLGHPLNGNLRNGNWAMDYIVNRLNQRPNLAKIQQWFTSSFNLVKSLPRHLIPMYFYKVFMTAYRATLEKAISMMPEFVQKGNWFVHALAITSIQFYGVSTPLISNPNVLEGVEDREASMAAGFPHFSTGYMRSWGRDTFISLNGILLVPGRIQEAKNLIIGFGYCLRFGLIPNLLDRGAKARYNARDATWWYLKSIQDTYNAIKDEKEKESFLQSKVFRLFPPSSDSPYSTIQDMIHEILQAHATGIHFREPNAGREIDDRMRDEGFNIDISLNKDNGFLYGGNELNAGTWMDKMGESMKAGSHGFPATPRDGAPIEITAMLYSTLDWVSKLNNAKKFKYNAVQFNGSSFSYQAWADLIKTNFEKYYFIPPPSEDKKYIINHEYVRRRNIYKDVVGSKFIYSDYQFRPNICVAMAFAPDLFNTEHAAKSLELIQSHLAGPLGMKTLDPNDPHYHGNYDNSVDSTYKPTARGFNYHCGPEWVWVYGFFLQSVLVFKKFSNSNLKNHTIESLLLKHKEHITHTPYESLPELTNREGSHCRFSCDSQAWSIATILYSLYKSSSSSN